MKKYILLIAICSMSMSLFAEMPITKEYCKSKKYYEGVCNDGKPFYQSKPFHLQFVNNNGKKVIFRDDKKNKCGEMIDVSKFDYNKNEGTCDVVAQIENEWYLSDRFDSERYISSSDKKTEITGIDFHFEEDSHVQLQILIYNDFEIIGTWVYYE